MRPSYAKGVGRTCTDKDWETFVNVATPVSLTVIALTSILLVAVTLPYIVSVHNDIVDLRATGAALSVSVNNSDCGVVAEARRNQAYSVRIAAAYANYIEPVETCPATDNGDEALYAGLFFASYSKGLAHDSLGHVDPDAYALLLRAGVSGAARDWDAVTLASGAARKLVNPQAGWAYTLQGADPQSFPVPAPPTFASALQAGEFVELAWMAYCRDVAFADYASDSRTIAAVVEIAGLTDFQGPPVLAASLFRGTSPGCSTGPYISQFLYMPCTMGVNTIDQRLLPLTDGVDFMTDYTEYLRQQEAQSPPAGTATYGATPVYIHTLRDLATWVHSDVLFQAYFMAMLCLDKVAAPLKPDIPYVSSSLNQEGFGTWGGPFVAWMSTMASTDALKAAWFQKWGVHRRLRPEVYGARVHNHKTGGYSYPLHADVVNSTIVDLIFGITGTYLLPMAFPEGSPLHPSYPAGHATVAGTCVTLLKALFVEDTVLADNLMPNPSNGGATAITLSPSATLTVGGELNKLAWNIAMGRNGAGVHWRSDATESLLLGQRIAIHLLRDLQRTFREPFGGFSFVDFDGNLVAVV